jgi:AcrR family transcriptional regulator
MATSARKRGEIERREREILAGAMALFSRDDWPSVSMDQIAAAADVSKGTLYNHFASKDDIYARLLIDFSGRVAARLEDLQPGALAEQQVREILAVLWDAYRENPSYRRISYYCEREGFRAALSDPLRAELYLLDGRFVSLTAAVLRQGIDAGSFREAPMLELQLGLRFVLAGMSRVVWSSEVTAARDDAMFRALCDFVLNGLGAHVA